MSLRAPTRHRDAVSRTHEVCIYLSDDERKMLGQLAHKLDMTYSALMREALNRMAAREGQKP